MIRDLVVWKGALIAGGFFTQAGAAECAHVGAWDGEQWSPLGEGLGTFGYVEALAEYSGELIAGGWFNLSDPWSVNVARWDGQEWSPLGPTGLPERVNDLAVYGGAVYADSEGSFYKWNGAAWQQFPLCCSFVALPSMTLYDDRLVAGWISQDGFGFPELARVRAWNGAAWQTLGGNMFGWGDDLQVGVAVGSLYAGAKGMAWRWDGAAWLPHASLPGSGIASIGEYQGRLMIGSVGGPYLWEGGAWQPLGGGVDGEVYATAEFQGGLVMGGSFEGKGGQVFFNFARWGCSCYPDCNSDGALNLSDFGCFQTRYALSQTYADCNGDGVRNLSDFGCFQTKFALGCP
jgi:hypothetical protein